MKVFYSDDYVAMAHAIDATRKPQWIAHSLLRQPVAGIQLEAPSPMDAADLERVCTPEFIRAVRTGEPRELAESSSYPWDNGVWTAELASCGGMLAAVRSALDEGVAGTLGGNFHHGRRERGWGHCLFNGLALAAVMARELGVERILGIDLDAHCGGGTYSIIGALPGYRQLDVSLFPTDRYRPNAPSTLDVVETASEYLSTIRGRLDEIDADEAAFQLCLYFAGMDPHEGSAFGGLPGIDAGVLQEREEWIFGWLRQRRIPCAFALGGGYLGPGLDREGLVSLHRATISAAAASWA